MLQLRDLLKDTIAWQARFAALRHGASSSENALCSVPAAEREGSGRTFYRVAARATRIYALMDYVNFKGEGVSPTNAIGAQGWGLLQVLERMPASGPSLARVC